MSLAGSKKGSKGGNYAGRRFTLDGYKIDPDVTDYTSRPWFNGKPCKRCGSTVRFATGVRQCVRCLKQWRKENRHKWKRHPKPYGMRSNPLRKSHGFGEVEYATILALQNGACAICKKPENFRKQKLSVDHDHETGNFRGLLCNSCNRGLGLFKDDARALLAAADYLLRNHWSC